MQPTLPVLLLLFSCLFTTSPLRAEAGSESFDRITLSVVASRDVTPDIMRVTLRAQARATVAAEAAAKVNEIVARAAKRLDGESGIDWQTLHYSTRAIHAVDAQGRVQPENGIAAWEVAQDLSLHGADYEQLAALSGELQQQGLTVQATTFEVSQQSREAAVRDLIDEAISRFEQRSEQVSRQLRGNGYRIVRLAIDEGALEIPRPLMARSMMMAEDAVAPTLRPGEQSLQVSAQGEIMVQRQN